MNTIQDYFTNAQLALAAYSDFSAGYDVGSVKTALTDTGHFGLFDPDFTTTSAQNFVDRFAVINQFTDSGLFGLTGGSGFSATVFRDTTTGSYTLAIRGTEPLTPGDFGADLDLATGSLARNQLVAMVNYVLRLQVGAAGETAQLQVNPLAPSLPPLWSGAMVQGVGPGIAPSNFTLTGHSLGGYLAQGFERLFGGGTGQLYTYNAPGFYGDMSLFNQVTSLLGLPAGTFATIQGNNLVVPGDWAHSVGMIPGLQTQTPIFSETDNAATPIDAHSIKQMTDSLAVYNLFATLDPSLNTASADNINKITNFLKASSNVAANSLEYTLDALRTLLQTDYTTGSANYLSSATAIDDCESLYANLQSLQTYLANSSFNFGTAQAPQYGFTLLTLDEAAGSTGLAEAARTDLASRYALYKGNTFVLDATGYDLYTNINANGALTTYDAATHTGELTDAYLKDRAAFLLAKVKANTDDASVTVSGANIGHDTAWAKQGGEEVFYQDKVSSSGNVFPGYSTAEIYQGNNTAGIQALTNSQLNDIKQIQFGSSISDTLTGGNKDDHLYGGAGNDTLTGGKGNDNRDVANEAHYEGERRVA
ncbi:MAG: hypothetical protein KGL01_00485 [Betaproteobacteria bacterium]|nr:hypothetical protein [Betaproteobacteria bacterium]